ncbi:hypothetical protein ACWDTB_21185, partial [Streptomyces sp. NPDC003487]
MVGSDAGGGVVGAEERVGSGSGPCVRVAEGAGAEVGPSVGAPLVCVAPALGPVALPDGDGEAETDAEASGEAEGVVRGSDAGTCRGCADGS